MCELLQQQTSHCVSDTPNRMVSFLLNKHNNSIQSSALQYSYMFRSFLDHLQANIFHQRVHIYKGKVSPLKNLVWPIEWVEVQLYPYMTATLGGEWSAARSGHTLPWERPGTHYTGGWVGPRAGLKGRKISPHWNSIPGPFSLQSVAILTEIPGPYVYVCVYTSIYKVVQILPGLICV